MHASAEIQNISTASTNVTSWASMMINAQNLLHGRRGFGEQLPIIGCLCVIVKWLIPESGFLPYANIRYFFKADRKIYKIYYWIISVIAKALKSCLKYGTTRPPLHGIGNWQAVGVTSKWYICLHLQWKENKVTE